MPDENAEIPIQTPDDAETLERANAEADDLERSLQNQRLRFNLWVGRGAMGIFAVALVAFTFIFVVVVWHLITPWRWLETGSIQALTLILATGSFVTNLISPALKYIRGEQY